MQMSVPSYCTAFTEGKKTCFEHDGHLQEFYVPVRIIIVLHVHWYVTQCSLADKYRHFNRAVWL